MRALLQRVSSAAVAIGGDCGGRSQRGLLVFLGLKYLHGYIHRLSPFHRPGRRTFYSRLADVVYYAATFLGADTIVGPAFLTFGLASEEAYSVYVTLGLQVGVKP